MSSELTPVLREKIESTLRFLTMDAVQKAGIGHVGAPLALARPALALWDEVLRFDPGDPSWPLRDRFVLSNGHASMLLYGLLHLYGFDLSLDDIKNFRQLGSRTPGHPEYGETAGVEVTTGPLGQGFAHAVGMALAGRLTRARFKGGDDGPGNHRVYGFLGDGDLMEGISSEAASFAGHNALGNLIFFYDDNQVTIDGPTHIAFSEDAAKRFESQGWHVEAIDGQDLEGIRAAVSAAQAETARPSLIITRTEIGLGAPNFVGKNKAHGGPYGEAENVLAKREAGWPVDAQFLVPDDVRAYLSTRIEAKKQDRLVTDSRLKAWRTANPEGAEAWDAARERRMPSDLGELLAEDLAGVASATRKHSGKVLERLWDHVPYLVGGSADLAGSGAPPLVKKAGVVGRGAAEGQDPFAGGNIHFGVREHAMAAITNGIALDGTFVPYSGTFLIFSDYMRPSIRLAALMKVRSIFVFTHDSIFVGEDGPTHQPVEQLDSLRLIPGLRVFRPADGVETAMAYSWILENAEGPAMLSLTRQDVDSVERREPFELRDVWRGGYAVRQPASGKPDVVIAASGSEVSLACKAADELAAGGIHARIVSMPCIELFLEQSQDYQDRLIPDDGTPLVGVEAGRAESFRRLVGRKGLIWGIPGFGASAPFEDLADHFGFVPGKLAAGIRSHVEQG